MADNPNLQAILVTDSVELDIEHVGKTLIIDARSHVELLLPPPVAGGTLTITKSNRISFFPVRICGSIYTNGVAGVCDLNVLRSPGGSITLSSDSVGWTAA